MTDNELVLYSVDGHVATLTLNRPDSRNALSADLMQALLTAFDKADSDDNVRALVLTGAGKVFCAGGDLSTMNSAASTLDAHYARERYANLFRAVLKLRKPIIAAVNGHAIGGDNRFAIERLYRDARLAEIGEGTTEIQKDIIAKILLRTGGRTLLPI